MNPNSVEFLRLFNEWRQYGNRPEPDPCDVTEAIDWACEQIERKRWRPIETAPKDGTHILACQETEPGFWEYEQVWWSNTWGFGGGACLSNPTHWTPLPHPPGETK